MKRFALPAALLGAVLLSGCVIDADSDWDDETTLAERTRLAVEACGRGNVAKVTSSGFTCKTFDQGAIRD